MKIELDLEQKHINALVTGLYLVIAKSMNIIPDMEQIRKDLALHTEDPITTYEEIIGLASNILEQAKER